MTEEKASGAMVRGGENAGDKHFFPFSHNVFYPVGHCLTHSHTKTPFDAPGKHAF